MTRHEPSNDERWEAQARFWERRYEDQHRTLHSLEDVLAATRAELERVMNERDLAVLTLAAFTPADQPLPVLRSEKIDG